MNLGEFIDTYRDAIAQRVVESYPPLYRPSEYSGSIPRLLRSPLGAQEDAIRGAVLSLQAHRGTTIVGEMGTGKTFIATAAAHMAGFQRVLVLCPPHLTRKWKREVEETVPSVRTAIVTSITDLENLRYSVGSGPLFAVMSRERAKLSYRWKPAVVQRWAVAKGRLVRDEETGEPFQVPCCPVCTTQILDKDGVPLTYTQLNRRKRTCPHCCSPLWQADGSSLRRYPLADYVKHRMKNFFDLLIGDEIHEYKGRGSAQGIAAGILADVCGKSLSLSGTLMGGYSSTLFHLLFRFSPEIRTEFGRSEEHRWIKRYGFEECTMGKPDDETLEDGRNSRRRRYRKVVRERPGLVPSALFHIIGNTVFLRLADVASGLPDYTEQVMLSGMDSGEDATGYSQRSAYDTVFQELRRKLADALSKGSKRLLSTYLQTLLAYPDGCTRGETVFDPESGDVIVQVPPLSEERLYPKEKALVDLVAKERLEGRRVLVYVTHTGTRDITGRMDDILTRHGFRVTVMKAVAVRGPGQAGEMGRRQGEAGHRRAHLPPQAGADKGLDLIDFPTIVWGEVDYSVYVMRQASRRSWRIGQTRPGQSGVHVLPEHPPGRRIEAGGEEAPECAPRRGGGTAGGRVGRLRRRRRRPDDGPGQHRYQGHHRQEDRQWRRERGRKRWRRCLPRQGTPRPPPRNSWWTMAGRSLEVGPEAVAVNGNGSHANSGNGSNGHRTDGIGPTVKLVLDNGPRHANGPTDTATASGRR